MRVKLPWHQRAWMHIEQRLTQGRLPHALLLTGVQGLGKRVFAAQLAQRILCHAPQNTEPCGECQACHLFQSGNHPDYFQVIPDEDKNTIKIEQVRAILQSLTQTPQCGANKVVVLDPVEGLNTASANALLKSLEEPPAGVYFLLITASPERLMATIRSRCQNIAFSPSETIDTQNWLATQDTKVDDPALLLTYAEGRPFYALQLTQADIDGWKAVEEKLKALMRNQVDPITVANAWAKLDVEAVLKHLLKVLNRLLKAKMQTPQFAQQNPVFLQTAYALYDELLAGLRGVRLNLNATLVLEKILMQWVVLGVSLQNVTK